ncbi:MAG: non-canonical purine NTP pyrophosphatase [Dysgonomonas sp.]|nr:non-canonical purine NTP pyrophosphatase [Dysgonomonas sp.]
MTDITFITSNPTKLAHARHLCIGYDVNILQYKKLFYGIGYEEPRLFDREKLLEESFNDAITRWKKNVSNYGDRLFFIEDTSVRIDALSNDNDEVPGVDVKYWMQSHNFVQLDKELKKRGNNRKVSVSSHIILFLTNELKKKLKTEKDHILFKSTSYGTIVQKEQKFDTQILYPWLDNKTFNKWFVPDGFNMPISMLAISEADKSDFRKGAFEQLLNFLKEHEIIKPIKKVSPIPRLHFNPLYIVCGPTCAGKSTIGKLLLEKYDYYHIEASDFMTLRYFETHGTKFSVDKNIFAAELLKVNPLFVVESTINYIISKKIFDNFIITGFRTPEEVESFFKMFLSQNMKRIYITADSTIRYDRWVKRQRDMIDYTPERFEKINKLQEEMGLFKIKEMKNTIQYENNKEGLPALYNDFQQNIIKMPPTSKEIDINLIISTSRISLEKAIFFILAIEYRKNESLYHTTTEISHLINNTFKGFKKNKNNISRYFNQAYYPYYEIKKEHGKNKYKLSPTGYSEAVFMMRNMK